MLKIQVVSQSGRPLARPVEVCLDENGGTMGRLTTNHIVLPDPERHVSRVHARIVHRSDGYFILHQGSNPILLNGATLRIGDQAPLNHGDELAVCTYRLRVAVPPCEDGATDAPTPSNAASSADVQPSAETESLSDVTSIFASSAHVAKHPKSSAPRPKPDFAQEPATPSGAVDFALDGPHPAEDAIGAAAHSPAELFFSWETDMDLYRMTPARSFGAGDIVNRVPAESVVQGRSELSDAVRPAMVETAVAAAGTGLHAGEGRRDVHGDVGAKSEARPTPEEQSHGDTSLRAAIDEALRRFSPEQLEQRLKHRTMLDSVLSINRKAKLWDLFTHMYAEIALEVQEDVHRVLARESLKLCAGKGSLRHCKEEIGS